MRIFISKRLPFGFRAGVLLNPTRPQHATRPTGARGIAGLGEGVSGVYVITGAHNMCKIGISTDPELRLAALQTGAHVALKLHYVLAVKTIDPRVIEALAHKILDKNRCAGEWFDVTPQMAEDAVNEAAAHYGIRTVQTSSNALGSVVTQRSGLPWYLKFLIFIAIVAALTAFMTWYFPVPDYSSP